MVMQSTEMKYALRILCATEILSISLIICDDVVSTYRKKYNETIVFAEAISSRQQ